MEALKTTKAYLEKTYGGKPVYRDNAVFVGKSGTVRAGSGLFAAAGYVRSPARGRGRRSRSAPDAQECSPSSSRVCAEIDKARDELRVMSWCIASSSSSRGVRFDAEVINNCRLRGTCSTPAPARATRCPARSPTPRPCSRPGRRWSTSRPIFADQFRVLSNVHVRALRSRVRDAVTAGAAASTGRWAAPCGSRDASSSKSMPRIFVRSIRATKSAVAPSQPIKAASSVSTGCGAVSLPPPEGGVSVLSV